MYLGTLFSFYCCFLKNSKRLLDQARKVHIARKLSLPVDIQLQIFDSMMTPILLHWPEVTGFEGNNVLESLYLQFYKYILKANIHLMLYYMVNWVVSQWI